MTPMEEFASKSGYNLDFKMDPEIKAQWVAALRLGEYQQGFDQLHPSSTFCCLGVLCDIRGEKWEIEGADDDIFDPSAEEHLFGPYKELLPFDVQQFLAYSNDGTNHNGWTISSQPFSAIADWIEANL